MRGTTDVGLTFEKRRTPRDITSYVDSDFAGDLNGQRSLIGYVFSFADCTVSRKTPIRISTYFSSTTKVEYMVST